MKTILVGLLIALSLPTFGQRLVSRNGHVWFFSSTPVEDIEAHTYQAASIINTENGEVVCQMLMKGFQFEKALMQEHFNEKYVESDKYPNAQFKGTIKDFDKIDLKQAGTYDVVFDGKLTIHGIEQSVTVPGKMTVSDESVTTAAKFTVKPEDHQIKIPSVVESKIAKEIDVNLDIAFTRR